jgi:hypothetical protein
MFTWFKHRGHSARWEITTDDGWVRRCSCGTVLIRHPGDTELSKGGK